MSVPKSYPMAPQRVFLGSAVDLGHVQVSGHVVIDAKPGLRQEIADSLLYAVEKDELWPAKAGKIRGKAGWAGSNSYGKCARVGMYQLKRRQYGMFGDRGPSMDADMRDGCVFMAHLMQVVGPRRIQVIGAPKAPLVVYSDASFDPDYWLVDEERREQPRLGWVCFNHNLGTVPLGRTMEMPHEALELFMPRQQQIYACEALAIPEAVAADPEAFRHRDVTWFVDNEAACSSLIRGASRQEDVNEVVAIALLTFMRLDCRVWFEWIDSDSNPADGLSRAGLRDEWTLQQQWSLKELQWCDRSSARCRSLKEWRWEEALAAE